MDVVYHAAIRFVTGSSVCIHQCNFLGNDKIDFSVLGEETPRVDFYFKRFTG